MDAPVPVGPEIVTAPAMFDVYPELPLVMRL